VPTKYDIARMRARSRMAVRKRRKTAEEQEPKKQLPAPDPLEQKTSSSPAKKWEFETPASWSKPTPPPTEDDKPGGGRPPGRPAKAPNKKRTKSFSLSVSPEEEYRLRKYLADQGLAFAPWARAVLFATIGEEIPPRD
jgi:hypothetical protein